MEEIQNEPVSVKQVAIKWGLILSIFSIVFGLIMYIAQIANNAFGYLGLIPSVIVIILAHKEFKNNGDGFMTFGQGLGIGTLISVISSVISSVFSYVYLSFIDSSYLDVIKDMQIEQMSAQGLSDQEIDNAMSIASFFMNPTGFLIMGILGGVFMGFILSLVVTAFTKNNNPDLEV